MDRDEEIRIIFDDEPAPGEGGKAEEPDPPPDLPESPPEESPPGEASALPPEIPAPDSILAAWEDAAGFPLHGSGKYALAGAAAFYAGLWAFSWVPFFGQLAPFAIFFGFLLMNGLVLFYFFKILRTSALGSDEMPDWPDLAELSDEIFRPFIFAFLSVAFCLVAPAVAVFLVSRSQAAVLLALLLGAAYLPMQILACAVIHDLWAFDPRLVSKAIVAMPGPYFLAVSCLWFVVLVCSVVVTLLFYHAPILVLTAINLFLLYALPFLGRLLGLLYRQNSKSLGWLEPGKV